MEIMKKTNPSVFALLSDRGWILERLASEISKVYPNFSYGTTIEGTPDIVYYMTYSCRKKPFSGVEIGYFTHIEEGLPAEQLFYEVAADMDACVTQATMYKDILLKRGIEHVINIPCGIDHEEFTPRLQVGVVGRTYHTGRKGEALIADLMDMEHIQFHFTGDGWPGMPLHVEEGKMGDFYRSMDYILVPSLYEGGPMCVPEALACGTPVIAPEIGWVPDFPHISYKKGDAISLRGVLQGLVKEKLDLAQASASYTWKRWAESHVELFKETWLRCGVQVSSQHVNQSRGLQQAKVIQVLHGGEKNSKGGPSVRVPYTADQLTARTGESALVYGAPTNGSYDIAHLYNIWQPDTALETLKRLSKTVKKRVFSPILLDLNLRSFWGEALPRLVRSAHEDGVHFRNVLPMLQAHYTKALQNRTNAIQGYQPVPGFSAKLRALSAEADAMIFLSQYEKALVEAYCGSVTHGHILHNPVDASYFKPEEVSFFQSKNNLKKNIANRLQDEFQIEKGSPFLVSVGRVEVRKNQLMKAAIARELNLPLVIAGHIGDQSYAKLVAEVGGGHVHYLGRIEPHSEDLLWLYQNCALFMSLSWAEGASLSILEAASTGAPLLLTDTSSEREYFGDVAAFTPPLDVDIAVEVARKKITSHKSRTRKAQHELIKVKYDWPAHIATLSEIYKKLI
ncbi:glycosyltransferase [Epibacterium sp. DP7N7-1]|nr:glycosyltransferase [Epibacterium sp. DP7N7-1]